MFSTDRYESTGLGACFGEVGVCVKYDAEVFLPVAFVKLHNKDVVSCGFEELDGSAQLCHAQGGPGVDARAHRGDRECDVRAAAAGDP